MLAFYGRELGVKAARKHLGWYLQKAGLTALRGPVLTADCPAQVIRALRAAFAGQELAAA
jgi:tRNA-dihydrouridine synthase B